jgi:hypothetical protein
MKKLIIVCAAALVAAAGAQAQERSVRGILGMGITAGGDTLASVVFANGSVEDVKGGELVHVYAGAEFRVAPQLTFQTTFGYHVSDTSAASNGSLRFSRYPLELLAHYQLSEQSRLGGGARFVNNAKVAGSGVLNYVNLDYGSTVGAVLEGEYLVTPSIGLKLRAVSEKYEPSFGGPKADGSHVGFYFSWYL